MILPVKDDLMAQAQIQGIKTLVRYLTNDDPIVTDHDTYVEISFNEKQRILLSSLIENQLRGKPGKIRVNALPVVFPPALRVYGKFVLMALTAAFLLGRISA